MGEFEFWAFFCYTIVQKTGYDPIHNMTANGEEERMVNGRFKASWQAYSLFVSEFVVISAPMNVVGS